MLMHLPFSISTLLLLLLRSAWALNIAFTNAAYDGIATGTPFEIEWVGDGTAVKIVLLTGPSGNLQTVDTIAESTVTSPYIWTPPQSLPAGIYAFSIAQGSNINYSPQFSIASAYTSSSSVAASSTVLSAAASSSSSSSASGTTSQATSSSFTTYSNAVISSSYYPSFFSSAPTTNIAPTPSTSPIISSSNIVIIPIYTPAANHSSTSTTTSSSSQPYPYPPRPYGTGSGNGNGNGTTTPGVATGGAVDNRVVTFEGGAPPRALTGVGGGMLALALGVVGMGSMLGW